MTSYICTSYNLHVTVFFVVQPRSAVASAFNDINHPPSAQCIVHNKPIVDDYIAQNPLQPIDLLEYTYRQAPLD